MAAVTIGYLLILAVRVFAYEQSGAEYSEKDFLFDAPDLTVTYNSPAGAIYIEAFAHRRNAELLKSGGNTSWPQLRWISLGQPAMMATRAANVSKLYLFSSESILFFLTTLNGFQQYLLAERAAQTHGVLVSREQILSLEPSRVECTLNLYDSNFKRNYFKGEVTEFERRPLEVLVDAPEGTAERAFFENQLSAVKEHRQASMLFTCDFALGERQLRTQPMNLTAERIATLNLQQKLFGSVDEVFVTRHQIELLLSELYFSLNLADEYQVVLYKFIQLVLTEFVSQTATNMFEYVPAVDVLKSLSAYNWELSYDTLGSIFTVEEVANKITIKTAQAKLEKLRKYFAGGYQRRATVNGSGSFEAYINFEGKSKQYTRTAEALNDINLLTQGEITWLLLGTQAIPKDMNVTKLKRANLQKTLTFSQIHRTEYSASFRKKFLIGGDSAFKCNETDFCGTCNPCLNNATCVNGLQPGGKPFSCQCAPGYAGEVCDWTLPNSQCVRSPCKNGGTCMDSRANSKSQSHCVCPPGVVGETCELVLTPITSCDAVDGYKQMPLACKNLTSSAAEVPADTHQLCAIHCDQSPKCIGFRYEATSKVCALLNASCDLVPSHQPLTCMYLWTRNSACPSGCVSVSNCSSAGDENKSTQCPQCRSLDVGKISESEVSVNFSFQQIKALECGCFERLTQLERLYLHSNELKSLTTGVFSRLIMLEDLQLYSNRIAVLEAGCFSGMPLLRYLYLSGNRLTSVPAGVFSGLGVLERLELHSNRIASLAPGCFNGMVQLKVLTLYHNHLKSVPADTMTDVPELSELKIDSTVTWPDGVYSGKVYRCVCNNSGCSCRPYSE